MERYQSGKSSFTLLRKFFIIISSLFIITAVINARQKQNRSWVIMPSPIYSNLKNLELNSTGLGYALGDQIITLENNSWHIMKSQPGEKPSHLFAESNNSIWITTNTDYQESKLLFYDGTSWQEKFNPLANTVFDLRFSSENFGTIAGLGEIAIYTNGSWQYLDPPNSNVIQQIELSDNSVSYVLSQYYGIYKYVSKQWKLIHNTANTRLMNDYNGELYFLKDSVLCRIENDTVKILSTNPMLENINSFQMLSDTLAFACGWDGIILKYEDKTWKQQSCPVRYNLNSIKMISDTLGWIVGDEGTILKFSSQLPARTSFAWRGFQQLRIYSDAKVVDDEYGVAASDFDGDGLVDIFTCGLFEKNHLYINKGNSLFIDEAELRGVSGLSPNEKKTLNLGACAGDLDNDGDDDLYVTLLNASNKIYLNLGDGYFTDYTSTSNACGKETDRTNSVIFGDVDNDGDLDIFIANENSTNRLMLNNGAGIFKEVTVEAGLTTTNGGTGCSFGDIDNDGDIDLFVANWSLKNILYKNLFSETKKLIFKNVTDISHVGGKSFSKSNAVVFSDIDNDADLDLFITNRKTSNCLYINNGNGIFRDATAEIIGVDSLESYGALIFDFDGDGYKDIYLSNVGKNVLYKNKNGKSFSDVTLKYGADLLGYSTGSAAADIDNDGDEDIYAANYIGSSSAILRNKLDAGNYIKINIEGINNNRNGIGAKIFVYPAGFADNDDHLLSYSEISAGGGYASMNDRLQTIRIQKTDSVDIKVIFPSGDIKVLKNVKSKSTVVISDLQGYQKNITIFKSWVKRIFLDPHKLFEFIKWLFILSIIIYSAYRGAKRYDWRFTFIISLGLFLIALYYFQTVIFEYQQFLFATILPLSSIVILLSLLHLYYERNRLKKIAAIEQLQIREKLSRDLHDDLASTIGSVAIFLELIRKSVYDKNEKVQMLFDRTQKLINDATLSITDLIWAVKPKPESISNLLIRVNENFSSLFREKKIKFKTMLKSANSKVKLNSKIKQNIYLIIKEALNNILKYSEAEEVRILVKQDGSRATVSIYDNGKGFNTKNLLKKGNGLVNMKNRAEEINAEFDIISNEGKGTKVTVKFKIT